MESVSGIKLCLKDYKESRAKLVRQVQELVNVRNQLTYVSSDMLQKAIGVDILSSRTTYRLSSRLDELVSSIEATKSEIMQALTVLASKVPVKAKDATIDNDYLANVVSQMTQQTALESIIVDKLLSPDGALIDQDSLTTYIACFEYPPYLVEADLDAVLLI